MADEENKNITQQFANLKSYQNTLGRPFIRTKNPQQKKSTLANRLRSMVRGTRKANTSAIGAGAGAEVPKSERQYFNIPENISSHIRGFLTGKEGSYENQEWALMGNTVKRLAEKVNNAKYNGDRAVPPWWNNNAAMANIEQKSKKWENALLAYRNIAKTQKKYPRNNLYLNYKVREGNRGTKSYYNAKEPNNTFNKLESLKPAAQLRKERKEKIRERQNMQSRILQNAKKVKQSRALLNKDIGSYIKSLNHEFYKIRYNLSKLEKEYYDNPTLQLRQQIIDTSLELYSLADKLSFVKPSISKAEVLKKMLQLKQEKINYINELLQTTAMTQESRTNLINEQQELQTNMEGLRTRLQAYRSIWPS